MPQPSWFHLLTTGQSAYCKISCNLVRHKLYKHNDKVCVLKPAWIIQRNPINKLRSTWALKSQDGSAIHLGNEMFEDISSVHVTILRVTEPVLRTIHDHYAGMLETVDDATVALELFNEHRFALLANAPMTSNLSATKKAIEVLDAYILRIQTEGYPPK